MFEWIQRARHVQHLVGGARKYHLAASVEFLKEQEVFWIPDSDPVDVLQVWEEELSAQFGYGNGFAFQAHQVMVCRGGIIQVDLFDGEKRERVSLAYGHVLYIPPCLWYSFFTKTMGTHHKTDARIQVFTDTDQHDPRWFCRMNDGEYAVVRKHMQRR